MKELKADELRKKIEEKAYEYFLKRGKKPGHHVEDWTKAEQEIMKEYKVKK